MTLLVVGGGAIGGMLAGYLTLSGRPVLLVDGWAEHRDAIQRDGLRVDGARGDHLFHVDCEPMDKLPELAEKVEVAFIAVKSYDTEAALQAVGPLLGTDSVVASTQNGLNEERMAELFGRDRVVGVVVELGGYLAGPGHVVETRPDGGFVIGELDSGTSERCAQLKTLLEVCATTTISDNILGVLWSKLTWNCIMNPLTAVSGLGQGRMLSLPEGRRLVFDVAREAAAVAKAAAVDLEPLTFLGVDPRQFVGDSATKQRAERLLLDRYSTQLDKSTSMSQDIERGRRTEIDHLNGFIVMKGDALSVPTPLNRALVELMHSIEGGAARPDPAHLGRLVQIYPQSQRDPAA